MDFYKVFSLLIEESAKHRKWAEEYKECNQVWTARMAAAHVCASLALVALQLNEKEKPSNVIPLDRSVQ